MTNQPPALPSDKRPCPEKHHNNKQRINRGNQQTKTKKLWKKNDITFRFLYHKQIAIVKKKSRRKKLWGEHFLRESLQKPPSSPDSWVPQTISITAPSGSAPDLAKCVDLRPKIQPSHSYLLFSCSYQPKVYG